MKVCPDLSTRVHEFAKKVDNEDGEGVENSGCMVAKGIRYGGVCERRFRQA